MKLCIRAHDLGRTDARTLAHDIEELGFFGAQLAMAKALNNHSVDRFPEQSELWDIGNAFRESNVEISMLASYFNPVHSNADYVEKSIERFKCHLRAWRELGAFCVGSETGSYNDDKWTYNEKNRTPLALKQITPIFASLADCARENGSIVGIEGAFGHVCYEPAVLKRLFDSINNGYVRYIVDIVNYLSADNAHKQRELFDSCIELFGNNVYIFHLKDCIVRDGEIVRVPFGEGIIDFDYMVPIMRDLYPHARLVFEGEKKEDVARGLNFFRRFER